MSAAPSANSPDNTLDFGKLGSSELRIEDSRVAVSPTISIVMAAYNREALVPAAIGSIFRQTRTDWELIVWDDGSTDGTARAAREAACGDPRVRVITGEHGRMSKSINSAAELATGKYFGWVDSDDAIAPTALAETVAVLDADPEIGMVYTDYLTMDASGRVIGPGTRTKIPYSKDRLLIDFMTFHFRLMRRELFDSLGGLNREMDSSEDYDLCLKLSEITQIHHLARPLYFYRVHKNTISTGGRLKQIEMSRAAIEAALKRRGLESQFELDVELIGRFTLRRKSAR
jgi:glycosyltransferase involved in cell wall biosynthesis